MIDLAPVASPVSTYDPHDGRISALRAAILELMCDRCDRQEQWRGRTKRAVDLVARMKGWRFKKNHALCPNCIPKRIDRKQIVGVCSYRTCRSPIARGHAGKGRPTNKCEKHLTYSRRWSANRRAKLVGAAI